MERATVYHIVKRTGDVAASALLLVGLAPVLGLTAVAILLDTGRPVFFRQQRSGLHGRPFSIVKFRTLRTGRHDAGDPGALVTRTGRFLRRWGLDELPQLWNVLRGEMSLVGPRPTLPDQVARYGPFERQRLQVRPGLTGWAQIHGRNTLSWPERIALDVWYVQHRSGWLDLRILLRTPAVLFSGEGVYGAQGQNPGFNGPATPPERATKTPHP